MALRVVPDSNSANSTNARSLRFASDLNPPIPDNLILLTTAEAAALIGIRRETLAIWRCTKRYNLPFVRAGRLVKYRKSELIAFLESRSSEVMDTNK